MTSNTLLAEDFMTVAAATAATTTTDVLADCCRVDAKSVAWFWMATAIKQLRGEAASTIPPPDGTPAIGEGVKGLRACFSWTGNHFQQSGDDYFEDGRRTW